ATTGDVFKAANRPGWIAGLAAVHLPVLCLGLWLLIGRGPSGAAAALTLAALASGAVAVPLALHVLGLAPRRLAAALAPQAAGTMVMALVLVGALITVAPAPSSEALVVFCVLGAVVYLATLATIDAAWLRELAGTLRLTFDRRTTPVSSRAH